LDSPERFPQSRLKSGLLKQDKIVKRVAARTKSALLRFHQHGIHGSDLTIAAIKKRLFPGKTGKKTPLSKKSPVFHPLVEDAVEPDLYL